MSDAGFAANLSVQQSFAGHAAQGRIEQLDHMKCGHCLQPSTTKATYKLQQAAWIGGSHRLRARGKKVINFAAAELAGSFGLQ